MGYSATIYQNLMVETKQGNDWERPDGLNYVYTKQCAQM